MDIQISITGVTPLICNRFTDAQAQKASGGTSSSSTVAERKSPQAIAESKLYIGLNGKIMVPQPNLLRCVIDGGAFHKAGRKQITTKSESMLFSCLDIEAAEIPIIYKQPWKVDTRAVVIPSTKGRILTHRPMFDDWRLEFEVRLDPSILSPGLLRQIVDDAGSRIGLGDFRPARKGPYGRFRVDRWEVIEVKLPMAAE